MEPQELVEQVSQGSDYPKWLGILALTTIVLAVGATLASFKEGNNSVDSVLNQTQAANQWAYYQSKSIKSYLYEMQRDKPQLDLKGAGASLSPELASAYKNKIESYSRDIERYAKEKKDIMNQAKKFEKLRDKAGWRAEAFGLAVIFLQMGILLSSIAALMRKKYIWIIGTCIGVLGLVYFANGLFHFVR